MNGSNMRDKARAIFGKSFFENTKEPAPAKNAAVALQKRANARPIPTYKVGGVVKKQAGGALTAAEKARAEKMIRERGDAAMRDPLVMRLLDEQNRAPMSVPGMGPKAATKRAEGGNIVVEKPRQTVPIRGKSMSSAAYADGARSAAQSVRTGSPTKRAEGGNIEAQRLEARADAGRYKHGGKIKKKAIGGVMEEYDTMPSSVRQAGYQQAAPAYGEYGAGPKPMQQMVANPNPIAPAYKKGGKIVKKAVGGAINVSAPSTRRKAQSGYDNYMNQMRMGYSTGHYDPTPYSDPAWQKANKIRVKKPLAPAPASTPTRRPLPTPGVMVGSGMVAQPAPAPGYKKGGKIVKKAVGGAMPATGRRPVGVKGANPYSTDPVRPRATMPTPTPKPLRQEVNPTGGRRPVGVKGANPYSTDPVRPRATSATPGMKKGGKPKDGLAVMIAIGKPMKGMKKPVKKALGGLGKFPSATGKGLSSAPSQGHYSGLTGREQHGIKRAEKTVAPRMGAPVKRAAGGAGKVRKGQMKGC